jgi:plasmid replication initiation protein
MPNDLVVVKANSLIEASYRLSIDEVRILALTIGTMDPKSNQKIFDFTVADFVREFPEISQDNAYKQIQGAIKRIYERSVKTEDKDRVTEFRWVSSRTYFKKEGRFRIAMTDEVMPYLTQLKGQFTQYQLKHIAYFNSVHSIRIYELITQYRKVGEREITVEKLKEWLQVEESYSRWNNFKARVLDPAISEINEKSDLFVEVEQIKRGRSIHALKFLISPKKQATQAVENTENLTKSGRPKLPQRPQVKKGTDAEAKWARECIKVLEDWRKTLKERGEKLSTSDLELLCSYYKITGDWHTVEKITEVIEKRQNKENKNE